MPKKIKFESFKYRFLIAAQGATYLPEKQNQPAWNDFVRGLEFCYENGGVCIAWQLPVPGKITSPLNEPKFYLRGDTVKNTERQSEAG